MTTKKSNITPARRRQLAINRIITNIRQLTELEPCEEVAALIEHHTQLLAAMYRHHVKASRYELIAADPSEESPFEQENPVAAYAELPPESAPKKSRKKKNVPTPVNYDQHDLTPLSASDEYSPGSGGYTGAWDNRPQCNVPKGSCDSNRGDLQSAINKMINGW